MFFAKDAKIEEFMKVEISLCFIRLLLTGEVFFCVFVQAFQ